MKKEFGKALRSIFPRKLKEEFPDFTPFHEKSEMLGSGERAYYFQASKDVKIFLLLVPNIKAPNDFTLEIGWSILNRFPKINSKPYGRISSGRGEFKHPECILRLSQLWSNMDPWWEVAPYHFGTDWQKNYDPVPKEEAVAKVTPLVVDAIQKFKFFGHPYLLEFLASLAKS